MGACEGIDFAPHPEKFSDRAADHKPQWTCVESGPVLVRWAMSPIQSKHCAVKTAVTVYRHLKRIDWDVQVVGNDDQIHVEQRLMFPINTAKAQIAYEVPFGVVRAGVSEPFVFVNKGRFAPAAPVPADPREIQNWVNVSDDGVGITLSSSVGACAFRDFGPGAESRPVISPILLACIANPDRKAYSQTGDFDFSFSLFSHQPGFEHGSRLGIGSQNPLMAVLRAGRGAGSLAPTCSFFSVQSANAGISTIKKAEDDNAVVVRLYDLDGVSADVALASWFRMADARTTDLLERSGKPLAMRDGACTVPVKAWGIETVKARLGEIK
jgi:alpha-mannosidase